MNKANKMAEVARLLGVELNEEFVVKTQEFGELKVRLEEKHGLLCFTEEFDGEGEQWLPADFLQDVLLGNYEIRKPPYIPKYNEFYFSFSFQDFRVTSGRWTDWVEDYARLKCGAIFRTRAEAEEARPRVYEMLTGKKWEGKEVSQHE